MNIVLSGGGTAGHINPALALAEELVSRGHSVYYAGTPQGVEARLVPEAGIPFTAFEASGFNRNHPTTIFRALRLIAASTRKAKAWFAEIKPDCVVVFGGYVCIPVGRAATALGIPVVIHEQNSVMGMANKYLSKHAARVALTYEDASSAVADQSKCVLTGNPVRRSMFTTTREEGRSYCQVPHDAVMLLVFGGSLGARHINTAVCRAKEQILAQADVYVRHITGPKEYDTVVADLALTSEEAQRWHVVSYEDHMAQALVASDAVVSRAGASSLAEISALQIPALLVPFPYATADHQTANARSYVESGAAFLIRDDEVENEEFVQILLEIISHEETRNAMRAAAAAFETQNAAAKLADVVEQASGKSV